MLINTSNSKEYLRYYPDLRKHWNHPLLATMHYHIFGKREGREFHANSRIRLLRHIHGCLIRDDRSKKPCRIEDISVDNSGSKFNFVYFVCRQDFDLLLISLNSLLALGVEINKVFIFIDRKSQLSKDQMRFLKCLNIPGLNLDFTRYPNDSYGINLIANELHSFKQVSSTIGGSDFIVKVDPDILFISDKIFEQVKATDSEFIGHIFYPRQKSVDDLVIAQGGCYFIRNSLMKRMQSSKVADIIHDTLVKNKRSIFNTPEDVFFSLFAQELTKKIKLTQFQFPLEILYKENAELYSRRYSVIHFCEDKKYLMSIYEKAILKKRSTYFSFKDRLPGWRLYIYNNPDLVTFWNGPIRARLHHLIFGLFEKRRWSEKPEVAVPERLIELNVKKNMVKLPGEVWAVTTYFNPAGAAIKYKNYRLFRKYARIQGLKLLAVELSHHSGFELGKDDADMLIQVSGNTDNIMWQKERLFNLALKRLPEACDKVIFIDNDIIFKNHYWVKELCARLEEYSLVQPFERVNTLDHEYRNHGSPKDSAAYSISTRRKISDRLFWYSTPGFCIAVRRRSLKAGLYDKAILGGGDALNFASFIEVDLDFKRSSLLHAANDAILDDYLKKTHIPAGDANSIGYVSGEIFHLWHGDIQKRGYVERYSRYIAELDISKDLRLDENGIYAWTSREMGKIVKRYFESREEDIPVERIHAPFVTPSPSGQHHDVYGILDKEKLRSEIKREPSITVIIPLRDRSDYRVANLLGSLAYQDYPRSLFRIHVCDYGSDNKHSRRLKRLCEGNDVEYSYLGSKGPFNKSKALNFLISKADTKYIQCADGDLIFEENYISTVVEQLEKHPDKIIFCEPMDCSKGLIESEINMQEYHYFKDLAFYRGGLKLSKKGFQFGKGINAGLAYYYKTIGGFDEFYTGWGFEDEDLMKRFTLLGLHIGDCISDSTSYLHQWHEKASWSDVRSEFSEHITQRNKDYYLSTYTIVRNKS